jgi:2,4-dienoyl-CoA reductase-like NADH-dependent reductase (Old Yellow Enzyme family)
MEGQVDMYGGRPTERPRLLAAVVVAVAAVFGLGLLIGGGGSEEASQASDGELESLQAQLEQAEAEIVALNEQVADFQESLAESSRGGAKADDERKDGAEGEDRGERRDSKRGNAKRGGDRKGGGRNGRKRDD